MTRNLSILRSRFIRFGLPVLVIALVSLATLRFQVEWDTLSGKERRVTRYLGIITSQQTQSETVLSHWVISPGKRSAWVTVYSRSPSVGIATPCYAVLTTRLQQIDRLL